MFYSIKITQFGGNKTRFNKQQFVVIFKTYLKLYYNLSAKLGCFSLK